MSLTVAAIIAALIALSIYILTCERHEPDYPVAVVPNPKTERLAAFLVNIHTLKANGAQDRHIETIKKFARNVAEELTPNEIRLAQDIARARIAGQ